MQVAISTNKLLILLYWAIYLALCLIAVWFAIGSGALDNFFSKKTSLSMDEEISTKRPVISIILFPLSSKQTVVLDNNTEIHYCPSYKFWDYRHSSCQILGLGENKFFMQEINKTERVFLEHMEAFSSTCSIYRIIPLTNLLEERAAAKITIISVKDSLYEVSIVLTSMENSLGVRYYNFKDGGHLQYELDKNSYRKILIQPESYHFLPETSKCHNESYYDCIASELDRFDFKQTLCRRKCIPGSFSYARIYSTPFCQTEKDDECARNLFSSFSGEVKNNFTKKVELKCYHSCNILQYSALDIRNSQGSYKINKSTDIYHFKYQFGNANNKMKAFHEYLIYDAMAMIGSVGGTFGLFIGFSMTGVIASLIESFKNSKIGGKMV